MTEGSGVKDALKGFFKFDSSRNVGLFFLLTVIVHIVDAYFSFDRHNMLPYFMGLYIFIALIAAFFVYRSDKLLDFGKFKYSQKKKEHKTKKKQHIIRVKEVRLRPITGKHDIDVKLTQARKFITKGDKVLFNMLFRGRELAHKEIGPEVFNLICKELEDISKVESPAKMEGKKLLMILAPK